MSVPVSSSCWDPSLLISQNITLRWVINAGGGSSSDKLRLYEISENHDVNLTYPHNVSILMNDQGVAFNYGQSNGSALDHAVVANITTSFNYSAITQWNLSFRSNTSGMISYSGLSINSYSYLIFFLFNQSTLSLVTTNSSYILSNANTYLSGWTTNGSIQIDNVNLSGDYVLQISNPGFVTNYLTVSLSPGSYYSQNVYLANTTSITTFTIQDALGGNTIQNASVRQEQYINGSWQVITVRLTDITGTAEINYNHNTEYRFTISARGYETQSFSLNPILNDAYTVRMVLNGENQSNSDWFNVNYDLEPQSFYDGYLNNISFLIFDFDNSLTSFGVSAIFPGGSTSNISYSSSGDLLNISAYIVGSVEGDLINISYYYVKNGINHSFLKTFYIENISIPAGSIYANRNIDYGLSILDKVLIMTIISILLAWAFTGIAGEIGGFAVGLFSMGVLSYILRIPIYFIIPGILIGLLLMSKRSS